LQLRAAWQSAGGARFAAAEPAASVAARPAVTVAARPAVTVAARPTVTVAARPAGSAATAAPKTRGPGGVYVGPASGAGLPAFFDDLLTRCDDLGAGLTAGVQAEHERKRSSYLAFVALARKHASLGDNVPANPRHVSVRLLVAFAHYLCDGCAATNQRQLSPATAQMYVQAVLRGCEIGAGGWRLVQGSADDSRLTQCYQELRNRHPRFVEPTPALTADEVALLAQHLDDGTPTGKMRRAVLLLAFWQGARGSEVTNPRLHNVNIEFALAAGKPTWLRVKTYHHKPAASSSRVKVAEFFSQYHDEFPVEPEWDAATALFEHMQAHGLLATAAESAALADWLKSPAGRPLPGRPVFPAHLGAVGADAISTWLQEACAEIMPELADTVSSRALRAALATESDAKGVDREVTMGQMGHASESSHKIYIRHRGQNPRVGAAQLAVASPARKGARGGSAAIPSSGSGSSSSGSSGSGSRSSSGSTSAAAAAPAHPPLPAGFGRRAGRQ
jgi:integrase